MCLYCWYSICSSFYISKQIKYTPSDNSWKKANGDNITNVKEAIDELYTKTNSDFTVVLLSENYNSGSNGMATLRTTEFVRNTNI